VLLQVQSFSRVVSALIGGLCLLGIAARVQAQTGARSSAPPVDQAELIRRLDSSDSMARLKAAFEIRTIPVGSRGRPLTEAVVRELDRLKDHSDQFANGLPAGPGRGEAFTDHRTNLWVVASQSDDPIVIRSLVDSVGEGAGRPIFDGLAKFGQPAATLLLQRAEQREAKPSQAFDFLLALNAMLDRNSDLSAEWRFGVAVYAGRCLTGRREAQTIELAIGVAVVLREPQLTARVSAIATAASAAEVGLVIFGADIPGRPDAFPRLRAAAVQALARIKAVKAPTRASEFR
jgi:hypothetical protein